MANRDQRLRRKAEVKERAGEPNNFFRICRVLGCKNPARAGTVDGLDMRFCRSHADHYQRHGSAYKGSYSARQLNPYRRAALAWIESNADDFWVRDAIRRVQVIYQSAGPHVEAFRLRGLSPADRAKAAWARLRKYDVDPRLVVATWLAIELAVRDDPEALTKVEYRRVQAAKVVHRMASGTHKRWSKEIQGPGNQRIAIVDELHVYPRSRGRVLRHIGEALESAVELLVDHHIDDISRFKKERDQIGRYEDRPYPKGWAARLRLTSA